MVLPVHPCGCSSSTQPCAGTVHVQEELRCAGSSWAPSGKACVLLLVHTAQLQPYGANFLQQQPVIHHQTFPCITNTATPNQSFEKSWCLKWSALWTPLLARDQHGLHWREHRTAAEGESASQSQGPHGPPSRTAVPTRDRGPQEVMAHSLPAWICHTSPTLLLSTNLYYYEKPCWCYTWMSSSVCSSSTEPRYGASLVQRTSSPWMDFSYFTPPQLRRHTTQQTLHHLPHLHPAPPVYVPSGCQLQQVHYIRASLSCLCILRKESTTISPAISLWQPGFAGLAGSKLALFAI